MSIKHTSNAGNKWGLVNSETSVPEFTNSSDYNSRVNKNSALVLVVGLVLVGLVVAFIFTIA